MDAAPDQFVEPGFGEKLFDIRLANTRRDPCQQTRFDACVQAAQRAIENIFIAAALIASDFTTFDRNERRGISTRAQTLGHFWRDELAVGENLEITIGMRLENFEKARMHERFAAQNSEEGVAMRLCVVDGAI